MFDCAPIFGLSTTPIPREVFHTVDDEHNSTTVRIPVTEVDRGTGNAGTVLDVVMEYTGEGFFRLGTRDGQKH
ncbi:hypothetical protein NPIL_231561 [Nephila pilipes]|uniref:Uncharacterized protein n=1 Tax=Nephila pilipes TaxID=299642 RepID=A0A8X6QBZ2_NEPPI|nr:hypothetical protein NPIL_231561 [Nephila pilipes]